ncbi:MAG: hypothetical protein ACRD9R_16890 [Pyrinomonadaceae bacterium]
MNLMKLALLITITGLILLSASVSVQAQSTSVLTTGLKAPSKIIYSRGHLLVAESGEGPNTGRVSAVDQTGLRRTLLDNLPSGFSAPNNEPSGPSGLAVRGRTLFVLIGAGDVVRAGPRPGSEVPNPEGPSSPILSSVLQVTFSTQIERLMSGFNLSLADQFTLANGYDVTLENGAGEQATVELVADFRDYVRDPNTIVRSSNPFGLALENSLLYIADASMNSVVRVQTNSRPTIAASRLC